ncbi:hypothetical protein [Hutsoniella sourekii]|uniref:hypothetical protein n=1 Tax=Hutsoniella sourekii TaxID=87650 RepID=UPI000485D67F|nr:hypothetical protein [Hutsoniella sourekii]
MSINKNFEKLLKEKGVPYNYQTIEDGHHLYRMTYKIAEDRHVVVEVIVQESDTQYCDAQIIYRQIHYVKDRSKELDILQEINRLNEATTGYYNLFLAGDGEVILRSLLRTGQDPEPLYQTIIVGSAIAKQVIPKFSNQ